jgi:hypothetical protein
MKLIMFLIIFPILILCLQISTENNDTKNISSLIILLSKYKQCEALYKERYLSLCKARQVLETIKAKYEYEIATTSSITTFSSSSSSFSFYFHFILITIFCSGSVWYLIQNSKSRKQNDSDVDGIENNVKTKCKNDLVASSNRNSIKIIDASNEMYVREAACHNCNENYNSDGLNECCMCMRTLMEIKQEDGNECEESSLKFTECGHVFCLKCMNKWFECRVFMAKEGEFNCPTCMRNLMRDHIIHVANIYI